LRNVSFRRTSEKGQPPVDFDAGLLSSWVQAELGLKEPGGEEVQTPEDLAGRIAAELQSQGKYSVNASEKKSG
jgi:hypothetical protein